MMLLQGHRSNTPPRSPQAQRKTSKYTSWKHRHIYHAGPSSDSSGEYHTCRGQITPMNTLHRHGVVQMPFGYNRPAPEWADRTSARDSMSSHRKSGEIRGVRNSIALDNKEGPGRAGRNGNTDDKEEVSYGEGCCGWRLLVKCCTENWMTSAM